VPTGSDLDLRSVAGVVASVIDVMPRGAGPGSAMQRQDCTSTDGEAVVKGIVQGCPAG